MSDSNSPEYQIGNKIGHVFMTYINVRLIIKGTQSITIPLTPATKALVGLVAL